MSSSKKINYSLRPNKSVERKLIFESLRQLKSVFQFSNYQYLGFGSVWFVDFIAAHKTLDITTMLSFEVHDDIAYRAMFNKPYDFVEIWPGDSETLLPKVDWKSKGTIAWLDYDKPFAASSAQSDFRAFAENARDGSVLIVTANADLKKNLPQLYKLDKENLSDFLTRRLGVGVPPGLTKASFSDAAFPQILASVIFNTVTHLLNKAGRKSDFLPLFNYHYADGASMITVGGMICDSSQKRTLTELGFESPLDQVNIGVPHLTFKEKIAIDSVIAATTPLSCDRLQELGIVLSTAEVEQYQKYYKTYPMFAELLTH